MTRSHRIGWLSLFVGVFAIGHSATATVLTFDFFSNSDKTIRAINNQPVHQAYGDRVSDFDPADAIATDLYVAYGSAGGPTPNVTVEYWWYRKSDGTTNGMGGANRWDFGYGGMEYVAFGSNNTAHLSQITFVPDPGYTVQINSFDYARWTTATMFYTGLTLKIVANANTPDERLLWQAGPDETITFPAPFQTASPMVFGRPGETVSILWGMSANVALDNISFTQHLPEPATSLMLVPGIAMLARGRRRARS